MSEIQIKEIMDDIKVIFTNKKIKLPNHIQQKIESYWNIVNKNNNFRRGEVYTITNVENINGKLEVYVELSDYAHYLYTINNSISNEYACSVIYTAALVKTRDSKIIFGEMASNTSTPNRLQCCGGGIDNNDIDGNSINLQHNISKELFEELGLDVQNVNIVKKVKPKYFKSGGVNNFLAIIYTVDLQINEMEFKEIYKNYVETLKSNFRTPEFKSIISLDAKYSIVTDFIKNDSRPRVDYLEKLLQLEVN